MPLVTQIGQTADASASIVAAANLRQTVGVLAAGAETEILAGSFATALAACFDAARLAGASVAAIEAVRAAAAALTPLSAVAGIVVGAVIQLAIACECRIVADMTFASRDQVESVQSALDLAFDAAIDAASDDFDQVAVVALTSLRAAVMRDLTARARPLPQIVTYTFAQRMPALWIANRLYGDGSRFEDLIAENSPIHPLFMPATGRALSR
jgi:prophage DNA circulation protein